MGATVFTTAGFAAGFDSSAAAAAAAAAEALLTRATRFAKDNDTFVMDPNGGIGGIFSNLFFSDEEAGSDFTRGGFLVSFIVDAGVSDVPGSDLTSSTFELPT